MPFCGDIVQLCDMFDSHTCVQIMSYHPTWFTLLSPIHTSMQKNFSSSNSMCNEHSLSLRKQLWCQEKRSKSKTHPRNLSANEPTGLRNHSILYRLDISSFIQMIITCCMNSRESRLDFWKPIDMNDYLTEFICPSPIARIDQIKPYFKF